MWIRQSVDVPVRLGAGTERVHGDLCVPSGASTVFVMFPGATYDSGYWDLPQRNGKYSQVRSLNHAGYATFTIDPLGNGKSSRPRSIRLTAMREAHVLHQLIGKLRAGGVGAAAFDRVVLMSHSLGSTIAALEAAFYRDVHGVVLTGLTHRYNVRAATSLFVRGFHPARRDPAFAGAISDPGYVTTRPGKRAYYFHSPSDPVPEMVDADERSKGVFPITDVPDAALLATLLPTTRRIDVPVLLAVGAEDRIMCRPSDGSLGERALLARESRYFGPKARLRAFVLPRTGHNLTMARNTELYQRAVIDWAGALV